ncbi:MAG: restriction endonuclease subunit S, partial [Firmicutes bacterium]|nr:restriction endonuclease subunit S [Bacillota bacterium]
MLASLKGLCPSGVLSVPLQTLWVRGPKSKVGVRKAQAMTEGTVPCYTSGEAVYKVTEYLVDGDYIFVNDGGSADFKYHEGKAYYTDHVVAITTKESIKAKYLYYYLQNTKEYIDANLFRGSGLKNLSITELGNYLIPLPPLPVQEEIVRILDTFTELIAELKAELKAELAARKKQYEFY